MQFCICKIEFIVELDHCSWGTKVQRLYACCENHKREILPVTLTSMSRLVFPLEFLAMMVYMPESVRFELGMVSDDMPSVLIILNHEDTGSLFFDQLISGGGEALEKGFYKMQVYVKTNY